MKLCANFSSPALGYQGRLAEFLRPNSRIDFSERAEAGCRTANGERFWPIICEQVNECKVSGPLISDAAVAAVVLEQGAVLCSTDKDFRRFAAVKLIDPLQTHSH
jgi:predicted nucleic acid-binding protein